MKIVSMLDQAMTKLMRTRQNAGVMSVVLKPRSLRPRPAGQAAALGQCSFIIDDSSRTYHGKASVVFRSNLSLAGRLSTMWGAGAFA
jgi:hypothetical protein